MPLQPWLQSHQTAVVAVVDIGAAAQAVVVTMLVVVVVIVVIDGTRKLPNSRQTR